MATTLHSLHRMLNKINSSNIQENKFVSMNHVCNNKNTQLAVVSIGTQIKLNHCKKV